VNILLDECVPARLTRLLTGHSVATVQRRGWAGIKNSELLKLAEKEHDVFVTVDRKISVQQDLTQFNIAVVLIGSRSNRLEDIRPLVPELLEALKRVTPRALTTVGRI
jgi:predicted nuclease of predicted toxin-antitoxin system